MATARCCTGDSCSAGWSNISASSGKPKACTWARHQSRSSCGTSLRRGRASSTMASKRSEEHTSELQSPCNLVCRLLLEKKKNKNTASRGRPSGMYQRTNRSWTKTKFVLTSAEAQLCVERVTARQGLYCYWSLGYSDAA